MDIRLNKKFTTIQYLQAIWMMCWFFLSNSTQIPS